MSRLLLVCGSQRADSLNARLLAALVPLIPAGLEIDRLPTAEIALPLFDQAREADPAVRPHLAALHARFASAVAIVVASPEYNGLMTPFLKNLIDWLSRLPRIDPAVGNAFLDKPVLLCSATPGWSGGAVGIAALRALFGYVGAVPFGETICLPYATAAWDGEGRLNPELPVAAWADCLARFCALAQGHQASRAA